MEAAKRFTKPADIAGYIEYDKLPTMAQQSMGKDSGQMENLREEVRKSGKLQELAELDTRSLAMEMRKVAGGNVNSDPVVREVQQQALQKEKKLAKGTTVEQDVARKVVEKETGKKVEKDDPAVQQKLSDLKEAKQEAARDITAPERPTEKTEEKVKEVKLNSPGGTIQTDDQRSRQLREKLEEAYGKNPAAAQEATERLFAKNALQKELGIPLLAGDPRIDERLKEMRTARQDVEQESNEKNISLNDPRVTEKIEENRRQNALQKARAKPMQKS